MAVRLQTRSCGTFTVRERSKKNVHLNSKRAITLWYEQHKNYMQLRLARITKHNKATKIKPAFTCILFCAWRSSASWCEFDADMFGSTRFSKDKSNPANFAFAKTLNRLDALSMLLTGLIWLFELATKGCEKIAQQKTVLHTFLNAWLNIFLTISKWI